LFVRLDHVAGSIEHANDSLMCERLIAVNSLYHRLPRHSAISAGLVSSLPQQVLQARSQRGVGFCTFAPLRARVEDLRESFLPASPVAGVQKTGRFWQAMPSRLAHASSGSQHEETEYAKYSRPDGFLEDVD
jgi:hypothetical protein